MISIEKREKAIAGYIESRKKDNQEPYQCVFQITTPKCLNRDFLNDENIKIVVGFLEKYGIEWGCVDTVDGAYNLNRDWIETSDIPCYVEYCGVYPIDWSPEDSALLEQMEYDGKIMVKVLWHTKDGDFVGNH